VTSPAPSGNRLIEVFEQRRGARGRAKTGPASTGGRQWPTLPGS